MKLDRDINADGKGKYALIKLRMLPDRPHNVEHLVSMLCDHPEAVVLGDVGSADEFFPIMLKDAFAQDALIVYARTAEAAGEKEYADAVTDMAKRAGNGSPFCKRPD